MTTRTYGHEFMAAVSRASKAAATTSRSIPVLTHVLIRSNGQLQITGTDLETFETAHCPTFKPAEAEDWSVAIPARPLADWLRSIEFHPAKWGKAQRRKNAVPPEELRLIPNLKECTLTLETASDGAKIRATFKGITAEEFPYISPERIAEHEAK